MIQHYDVVIIGAGPSGAVAAALLNKRGFNVCVVEKQHFPRFVIGESLLPHCIELLHEAGFLPAVQKVAGISLVALGVMMWFGWTMRFMGWLSGLVPFSF